MPASIKREPMKKLSLFLIIAFSLFQQEKTHAKDLKQLNQKTLAKVMKLPSIKDKPKDLKLKLITMIHNNDLRGAVKTLIEEALEEKQNSSEELSKKPFKLTDITLKVLEEVLTVVCEILIAIAFS